MKTVLMLEDDDTLQQLYRDALSHENILVESATTGKEGLEKMKQHKPDLLLLDIMLPGGMNGFDVVAQMKKNPPLLDIPIVVLTNLDSEKKTAYDMGAKDYLVKTDTSMQQVVQKIKSYLEP